MTHHSRPFGSEEIPALHIIVLLLIVRGKRLDYCNVYYSLDCERRTFKLLRKLFANIADEYCMYLHLSYTNVSVKIKQSKNLVLTVVISLS